MKYLCNIFVTTMLIFLDSSLEFDKDELRLWARPSEELGAIEVFISFIHSFIIYVRNKQCDEDNAINI